MGVEGAERRAHRASRCACSACSADWDALKFTMDPDMSRAVREAFVRLYEEGLIYRDTRLINWCSDCRTALCDLEVENEETRTASCTSSRTRCRRGRSAGATELVVATTRPETMLGDTAVAVHPDDPRYTAPARQEAARIRSSTARSRSSPTRSWST